jgi:hypothetical protein
VALVLFLGVVDLTVIVLKISWNWFVATMNIKIIQGNRDHFHICWWKDERSYLFDISCWFLLFFPTSWPSLSWLWSKKIGGHQSMKASLKYLSTSHLNSNLYLTIWMSWIGLLLGVVLMVHLGVS